jgi:hypothetical protein
MKTVKSVLLMLVVIFVSCKEKSNPVSSTVDYSYFTTSWTNSYEEETINHETEIFRPSNYKEFPLSRYREKLTFTQDSNCRYLVLAPNDAHYFLNGKWSFVNRDEDIVQILDSSGAVYKKFHIVELHQDLLKLIIVN